LGWGGAAVGVGSAAGKFLFVLFMLHVLYCLSYWVWVGGSVKNQQRTALPRASFSLNG